MQLCVTSLKCYTSFCTLHISLELCSSISPTILALNHRCAPWKIVKGGLLDAMINLENFPQSSWKHIQSCPSQIIPRPLMTIKDFTNRIITEDNLNTSVEPAPTVDSIELVSKAPEVGGCDAGTEGHRRDTEDVNDVGDAVTRCDRGNKETASVPVDVSAASEASSTSLDHTSDNKDGNESPSFRCPRYPDCEGAIWFDPLNLWSNMRYSGPFQLSFLTRAFLREIDTQLARFHSEQFFPDILMVHDPDNIANAGEYRKYMRVYPVLERDHKSRELGDASSPLVAHLYLDAKNRIGSGHHSYVHRTPLTTPLPMGSLSTVTVAAKTAFRKCGAHKLLTNEAQVYNSFPKELMDYFTWNFERPRRPLSATVPTFFGWYLPVMDDGTLFRADHVRCESKCEVDWPSPILLMEECGEPVRPAELNPDERVECFSLLLRLHEARITHGSFYARNILIEPGPLCLAPERRSFECPSFRTIDFGRAQCWERMVNDCKARTGDGKPERDYFLFDSDKELSKARDELHMPFDYDKRLPESASC
ncbi:hypothetical protein A0H81_14031 [Grifola frondosa]|uniref:Protein kinase domain-containing protein n=1 Tax=Grifola frondosa TaxID=5627 RepID=A0A1C7LMH6_GRIFR|nr:hypothetical protein A0H81_14031 [Grifola frondosa]